VVFPHITPKTQLVPPPNFKKLSFSIIPSLVAISPLPPVSDICRLSRGFLVATCLLRSIDASDLSFVDPSVDRPWSFLSRSLSSPSLKIHVFFSLDFERFLPRFSCSDFDSVCPPSPSKLSLRPTMNPVLSFSSSVLFPPASELLPLTRPTFFYQVNTRFRALFPCVFSFYPPLRIL